MRNKEGNTKFTHSKRRQEAAGIYKPVRRQQIGRNHLGYALLDYQVHRKDGKERPTYSDTCGTGSDNKKHRQT
eukprot:11834864-Heterocapsa_arctica.AAC.1